MNNQETLDIAKAGGDSEFLLYNTENGDIHVQVRFFEGSVWLSQKSIADIYQKSPQTISFHINEILNEGELKAEEVSKYFTVEQVEGKRKVQRKIICYNLEMIIAVGYRVQSSRGTQFRQWATQILREYVTKGFVLDDNRLANPPEYGDDYFENLLERIRVIRASEKRLYKKVLEIYALSVDYNPQLPEAKTFFSLVQNKIHYAVHQHTAAELIMLRASADKPNMGLTTWKNAPKGIIQKTDVITAKNYLSEEELAEMNSLVSQFLEYADRQARRRIPMTMKDWEKKLNDILQVNDMFLLTTTGKVSHEQAVEYVGKEYTTFMDRVSEQEKIEEEREFNNLIDEAIELKNNHKSNPDENLKS